MTTTRETSIPTCIKFLISFPAGTIYHRVLNRFNRGLQYTFRLEHSQLEQYVDFFEDSFCTFTVGLTKNDEYYFTLSSLQLIPCLII